jgi:hypothetical protein
VPIRPNAGTQSAPGHASHWYAARGSASWLYPHVASASPPITTANSSPIARQIQPTLLPGWRAAISPPTTAKAVIGTTNARLMTAWSNAMAALSSVNVTSITLNANVMAVSTQASRIGPPSISGWRPGIVTVRRRRADLQGS